MSNLNYDHPTNSKDREWRELICSIEGVLLAKPVFSEDFIIKELHILADDSRNAKQIARDIQSAIMAKFDIDLDYRIISVAQIPAESSMRRPDRLRYHSLTVEITLTGVTVSVELSYQDNIFKGVSSGRSTLVSKQRAIALATIEAIDQYIGNYGCFELLETALIEISGKKAIHTVVYSEIDRCSLIGSVLVNDDNMDTAVIKAVLDAVNRRINKKSIMKQ